MFKHKKTSISCILILLVIAASIIVQQKVYAEGSGELSIPFTVSPIMPDNQKTGVSGYFDLQTRSGSKQTIHVRLRNDDKVPLVLDISPANALTVVNGGIQYTSEGGTDTVGFTDPVYAMKDRIEVQPKVSIPAGETLDIPVTVTAPDKAGGTFLGGLLFAAEGQGEGEQAGQGGSNTSFTLKNRVQVAMAIQLDLSASSTSNLSFGDVGIKSIPSGSQLFIDMINNSPAIAKDTKGSYEVLKGSTVVMKGQFGPFNMAPGTKISYPVFWGNDLVSGEYTVKLEAQNGGQKISDEKSFTIGAKEQNDYHNVTGRNPIPDSTPWWIWICGGAAFLFIIILVYMIGRRQGSKNTNNQ